MSLVGTKNSIEIGDKFLTTKELAAMLKCSLDTLKDWRTKGTGPSYIKAGRKILYPLAVVRAWLSEREAQNSAQVEARLRKERLAKAKLGDEDYALNLLMAAIDTLPANIEGHEAWRCVQYMEIGNTDAGEVCVNELVLRDEPVRDADIERMKSQMALEDAAQSLKL